jgi:hypothetical protein
MQAVLKGSPPPAPTRQRRQISWDQIRQRLLEFKLEKVQLEAVRNNVISGEGGSALILDAGTNVVRVFVVGQDWILGDKVMRAVDPAAADMGMSMLGKRGVVEMFESSTVEFNSGYIGIVTTERLYKLSEWIQGLDWADAIDLRRRFAESWSELRERVKLGTQSPGPFDGQLNIFDLSYSTYKDNIMVRNSGEVVVADVFPPDTGDYPPVVYDESWQPIWTDAVWSPANIKGQQRGMDRMDLLAEAVGRGAAGLRTSNDCDESVHTGSSKEVALYILENREQFATLELMKPPWRRVGSL